MERKRFTEEQIIKVLNEYASSCKVEDICRRHGITVGTFYRWKYKYESTELSETKRLNKLESENAKLKKLLAESKNEQDNQKIYINHTKPLLIS